MSQDRSSSDKAPARSLAFGRTMALAALGTGAYMSALSGSIVNAILPIVAQGLSADVATIEWVVALPLLIQAGLLMGFGRLGDLRGHKPLYLVGLTIIVSSSALCGLAIPGHSRHGCTPGGPDGALAGRRVDATGLCGGRSGNRRPGNRVVHVS